MLLYFDIGNAKCKCKSWTPIDLDTRPWWCLAIMIFHTYTFLELRLLVVTTYLCTCFSFQIHMPSTFRTFKLKTSLHWALARWAVLVSSSQYILHLVGTMYVVILCHGTKQTDIFATAKTVQVQSPKTNTDSFWLFKSIKD